jgi:hypothetical protein
MSATQESNIMPIAFSLGNSDTLYYKADELKVFSPEYFKGTSKSIRTIITRKNIPVASFIYASFSKKNGWALSNEASKPAKLLIMKEWIDVNMFKKLVEGNNAKLQIDGLYKEITNLTKEIVNLEEKNETLKVTMSAVLKCETDYLKSELKSVSKESELTLRVKDMEIEKLKLAMKIK